MLSQPSKKTLAYSQGYFEDIEAYNYHVTKGNPTPTPTVAMAVWDMYKRGFSRSAIQQDLDDLCIDFDVYSIDFDKPRRKDLGHYL